MEVVNEVAKGLEEDGSTNELDVSGEEAVYRAMRDFWHPVMYAADLKAGPQKVVLLDEQLVVVRLSGKVCCFPDLCVHRGTALSLGSVDGDQLRCVYHGWTYGADGVCTSIPARHGTNIPRRARLHSYLVEEKNGLIWVCLEEDPYFPLPEFPEFSDSRFRIVPIPSYDWTCSATRRVENYVDFAHFAWLHDGVLGSRDQPEVPDHEVWREGSELRFEGARMEPPTSKTISIGGETNVVHSKVDYRLFMPFSVWLHQGYDDGKEFVLFMAASPVSRKRTRSFTLNARNYAFEDDDQKYVRFQEQIVAADKPVAESQRPEELPMDLSAELHVKGVDKVSIEYRKWLIELKELGQTRVSRS